MKELDSIELQAVSGGVAPFLVGFAWGFTTAYMVGRDRANKRDSADTCEEN